MKKKISRDNVTDIAIIMEVDDGDRKLSAAKLLKSFEEISPVLVASYLICLYEVFEEVIAESDQIDFQKTTFTYLKKMLKTKENHTEIIYLENNDQE